MTRAIACLLGLMLLMPARAELLVLGAEPGLISTQQAIGDLFSRVQVKPTHHQSPGRKPSLESIKQSFSSLLPITTMLLPSRATKTTQINAPLTSPVCLLGSDSISQDWLVKNRAQLVKLHARCFLIEAPDQHAIENMTQLAKPLPLVAVRFDAIAQSLDIQTYPVLLVSKALTDVK